MKNSDEDDAFFVEMKETVENSIVSSIFHCRHSAPIINTRLNRQARKLATLPPAYFLNALSYHQHEAESTREHFFMWICA